MLHLRLLFLPLMIYEEEEKETKLAHDLGVWKEAGLIPEIRPLSLAMGTRERGPSPIPQTLPPPFFPLPSSFFLSEPTKTVRIYGYRMVFPPLNYTVKIFGMSYNIRIRGVGHNTTGRRGGGFGKVWQVGGTHTDVMLLSRVRIPEPWPRIHGHHGS